MEYGQWEVTKDVQEGSRSENAAEGVVADYIFPSETSAGKRRMQGGGGNTTMTR